MLRGADVFVRGVLTASFGVNKGDVVAIWADLGDEVRWCVAVVLMVPV